TWLKDGTFFYGPVTAETAKQIIFKLPLIPIIFILLCIVFFIILKRTVYGRHVFAVGGNAEAAKLSGIKVDQNRMVTYILCAMLAALNGLLLVSWTKAYATNMTYGFELDVIAAVIIGGTTLAGGVGSIGGTVAGLIILQILYNMINLGIDLSTYGVIWSWAPETYVRQFIKGIIIIGAVIMQGRTSKK
ncbi:MAG: ABC transporter permease, partial [Candidatus Humimicrobiaceae bacterium]